MRIEPTGGPGQGPDRSDAPEGNTPAAPSILVPLDGTSFGELALPYAERLAHAAGARLVLAHVVGPSDVARREQVEAYFESTARRLATAGTSTSSVVLAGDIPQALVEESRHSGAQLMVVATHGRSGASRWLYGQVTEFLLPRASVPVLLIPEGVTAGWPDERGLKILAGLDGSSSDVAIVQPVANLARWLDAEVVLAEVVEPAIDGRLVDDPAGQLALARAHVQEVAATVGGWGMMATARVELGRPARVIMRLMRDEHFHVLAMGTHGQTPLVGSVATEVLEHAEFPVLLVRPEA